MDRRFPDFFIIGTAKAGTTAMHAYLDAHPALCLSRPKEPQYFIDDFNIPGAIKDVDGYLACFAHAAPGQLRGDASPNYLYSTTAVQNIHAVRPDAKLIAMLRQPADMMYSLHGQLVFNGDEPLADFEMALAAERWRRRGWLVPRRSYPPESLLYRAYASFGEQMERVLRIVPRRQLLVLIYDDFKRDPPAALREVLSFLDVRADVAVPTPPVNVGRRVRRPTLHFGLTLASRVAHDYRRSTGPRRAGMAARATRAFDQLRGALVQEGGRPPLDPALRRRLTAEAEPDLRRLERALDIDLARWRAGTA